MAESEEKIKVVTTNRKAFHDYEIIDRYEAGLSLVGTEVKSLRLGKAQMVDAYAVVEKGEVFLVNLHISQYDTAHRENHDPTRKRRLLLNRREIRKMWTATHERGFALIPLRVYFKGPYAKVEIAVTRGKRRFDKRQTIAKREANREIERKIKDSHR